MKLLPIRKKDFEQIQKLVTLTSVMKHIGNGQIWDNEKITNFIIYNAREQKLSNEEREYFYYRMVNGEEFVGIIGFYLKKTKYNLQVFIKPTQQKKGYFSQALRLILKRLKDYKNVDRLYSQVHSSNTKMNSIMANKYYFNKSFRMGKIVVNQFIIFNRNYTYLAKSDYISNEVFDEIFKLRGNWEKWDSTISKNPDFLHLDGKHYFDRKNQKYDVLLKNVMNNGDNPTIDKTKLFMAIERKYPDQNYLPETHYFDKTKDNYQDYSNLFAYEDPWIVKPDGGYAGSGIKIITKVQDLKYIRNKKHRFWSIQEYIKDPLLINGYKFHLRVLFIRRDENDGFVFEQIPVYLSQKEFKLDDYDNHQVHISHYTENQEEIYLDSIYGIDTDNIRTQIKKILRNINSVIKVKCYPETRNCYELYGVDFMVTSGMEVKLLEFNHKIGLKEFNNSTLDFNKLLLNAELSIACDYYLPPLHRPHILEDIGFESISK